MASSFNSSCVDFSSSSTASTLLVNSPASLSRSPPTSFITRQGRKLYNGNAEFKAVGPNVYWLGLDENINNAISYPTPGRVMEIMATAAAMGATAIRSTTLGVSVGSPLTISPSLGNFSEDALRVTDFAVYAARMYGIRLIIPLTDQYDYYHGGKLSFLRFRNLPTSDEGAFYTNTDVISDYKQYIGTIVNRTNIYTNTTYKNDPTILCWETGNELKDPPASWTEDITTYIKSLAPTQLTMDGAYGVQKDALDLPSVDIYSNHYYPPEKHKLNSDVKLVAAHNKAYYVGEYDWTDKYSRYGLFACLIPLIFVLVAFCLPGRWWPWTFYLPRWLSFKKSTGHSNSSHKGTPISPGPYSPLHDVTSPLAGHESADMSADKDEGEYPPALKSPATLDKYDGRRRVVIRKWMFALSFLLLIPFAAWIALEVGPTSLSKFLSIVEDKEVVGSAYWSLFGRDNDCCQWVEHDDGFTIHYRQDKFMKRSLQLSQHAYRMSGAQAAFDLGSSTDLPVIGCPAAINLTNLAATGQT